MTNHVTDDRRPTTDETDGNGPGARLVRRLAGAFALRRTSRPISAVTRSALERDGFEVWPGTLRESQRISPDHEA